MIITNTAKKGIYDYMSKFPEIKKSMDKKLEIDENGYFKDSSLFATYIIPYRVMKKLDKEGVSSAKDYFYSEKCQDILDVIFSETNQKELDKICKALKFDKTDARLAFELYTLGIIAKFHPKGKDFAKYLNEQSHKENITLYKDIPVVKYTLIRTRTRTGKHMTLDPLIPTEFVGVVWSDYDGDLKLYPVIRDYGVKDDGVLWCYLDDYVLTQLEENQPYTSLEQAQEILNNKYGDNSCSLLNYLIKEGEKRGCFAITDKNGEKIPSQVVLMKSCVDQMNELYSSEEKLQDKKER